MEWAIQQTQSGPFVIDPAITTEGLPVRGLWYAGHLDVGAVGGSWTLTLRGNNVIYVNGTSAGVWAGWGSYYAATPPQEYDLPMEVQPWPGYPSKYWKNAFGEVGIHICYAVPEDRSLPDSSRVAMLPEGFRPKYRTLMEPGLVVSSLRQGGASIDVMPDGSIYYFGPNLAPGDTVWGSVVYVAQSV